MSTRSECSSNSDCKVEDRVVSRREFSSSEMTSSLGCWSDLPEEIKVGILSCLRERDLIAGKLVCREWNFLISRVCIPQLSPPSASAPFWGLFCFDNPTVLDSDEDEDEYDPNPHPFAHNYFRLRFVGFGRFYYEIFHRKEYSGLPTVYDHVLSLLPSRERNPCGILDFCNGLILLGSTSMYYVGNPATRQRFAIPVNTVTDPTKHIFHSSLIFDPSITMNYKIVSFLRPAAEAPLTDPLAVDVFSSQTGHWSSHVLSLEPHNLLGPESIGQSVYFDGALYYMLKTKHLVCIEKVVVYGIMDGSHLKAWAIELPDKEEHSGSIGYTCGCIGYTLGCFYYSNRDSRGSSILVWMLVEEGKNDHRWVLKHTISITFDIVSPQFSSLVEQSKRLDAFRPRSFHPNDEQLILAGPRLFLFYHLHTKEVSVVHIPFKSKRSTIVLDQNWIFPYSQCMLLLNQIPPPEEPTA